MTKVTQSGASAPLIAALRKARLLWTLAGLRIAGAQHHSRIIPFESQTPGT
jgi:hypothetical protein